MPQSEISAERVGRTVGNSLGMLSFYVGLILTELPFHLQKINPFAANLQQVQNALIGKISVSFAKTGVDKLSLAESHRRLKELMQRREPGITTPDFLEEHFTHPDMEWIHLIGEVLDDNGIVNDPYRFFLTGLYAYIDGTEEDLTTARIFYYGEEALQLRQRITLDDVIELDRLTREERDSIERY